MMPTRRRPRRALVRAIAVAGLALAWAAGCSKADSTSAAAAGSSVSPPASAGSAAARPGPSAASSAATAGKPAQPTGRWTGSYVAKVGVVEPPKNANEKAWLDDPGATATGKGTVELVVGEPTGEARGHVKGPLGDLVLAGTFDGHELYANLTSAEPNADGALSGVMTLVAEGAAMKGSARVSGHDGKTVRQADLELTRQ